MKHKIFFVAPIIAIALSACSFHGTKHEMKEYVAGEIEFKNADFKILQLTDTHIGDKDNQDLHFKFLQKVITDAGHVDLIVITGDLFTFASKGTAKRFFKFMDSQGTPWTAVFGNHDEQCYFSIDWMTSQLNNRKAYPNCIFKDLQDDPLQGNCNFAINVKKGGKVFEQLIMIDSERYDFGTGFGAYDYIKDNQIEWYKEFVKYSKETTDFELEADARSLMFYHIPLPEINDAYDAAVATAEAIKKGETPENPDNKFVETVDGSEGLEREKTCPPDVNSGLFDAILETKNASNQIYTTDMAFGHDHRNTFIANYKGVTFAYGVKSTDRVYYDADMLGGQLITLKDDRSVSYERLFHTYKEVK